MPMNSIFSVDDFSDLLWQGPIPSPAMSRSPSEWELANFLEDFPVSAPAVASSSASGYSDSLPTVVSNSKPQNVDDDVVEIGKPEFAPVSRSDRVPSASPGPDDYRSFLKSQLDLACAAAAKARESSVKPEVNSSLAEDQRIATENCQLESHISGNGLSIPEITKSPSEVNGRSPSVPALPSVQKKQEAQVRQTTSISSREDSDDDELDGDTETNELGPSDEKRARRMLSNRESARRSRRRKQAQLNELETQVGQLRDERTTLLTRLTDINKKCDDASVDNRILNANIETLRTKVKMAEDQVKRVTGLNPLLLSRSNMANAGMQFGAGQTDAPANVALPMQPNNNHYFHHSVPNIASGAPHRHILRVNVDPLPSATNPRAGNGTTNAVVEIPRVHNVQKPTGSAVNQARELPASANVANQPVKLSRKNDL